MIHFKIIVFALTLAGTLPASAAQQTAQQDVSQRYTDDSPLIYEDIWDVPPYTFLSKEGEPMGFSIELVKTILKRLDIPYIIKLRPSVTAYDDLKNGKSDLMLGMHTDYNSQFGNYGRSVVALFTHGVAHPAKEVSDIESIEDLKRHVVGVHRNSYSHRYAVDNGFETHVTPYDDINEAIQRMATQDSGQVMWNTLSLKYAIKRYNLNNLEVTPIDIPNGEYRFMSGDKQLLELIDSVYEIMAINEELQPIRNKWFYPDMQQSGIPEYVWNIVGALAFIILLLLAYNRIYHIREKMVNNANTHLGKRLALYLQAGKTMIWTYSLERKMFCSFTLEGDPNEKYTEMGFSVFFNNADFKLLLDAIRNIKDGKSEKESVMARCHRPSTPEYEHYFDVRVSVLRRDKNGNPTVLLGTQQNITRDRQRQLNTEDLQRRFRTVFNSMKVDMALYDSNGNLLDINREACHTLGDKKKLLAKGINIKDVVPTMDMEHPEMVYASSIINRNDDGNSGHKHVLANNVTRYEMMTLPIFQDKHIIGYFVTGRDMTELAQNIAEERQKTKLIRKSMEKQAEYLKSINYALEVSNIWLVNYYPDTRMLEITYDLSKPVKTLTQLRCVTMLDNGYRTKAIRVINRMDKRQAGVFNIRLKTQLPGKDRYLQVGCVPIYNKDGSIDRYFGLCRDVSRLEEIDRKLNLEMKKALEAETVKSAFLKNMSYEIRTPLNAVIGFAELFDMPHATEDEPVFMTEIKKNSDLLLRLVNDILQLSRIDANMIEINKTDIDIAEIFGAHCINGWSAKRRDDVKQIVDSPYEHLIVDIDSQHVGKIIEILASNSMHFTYKGIVRGRYEYHSGELTISMEDSGVGITDEAKESILDHMDAYEDIEHCCIRLSLMICHKLVEKMGGRMSIESEIGKGTTIWITLPCTAKDIEKKQIQI